MPRLVLDKVKSSVESLLAAAVLVPRRATEFVEVDAQASHAPPQCCSVVRNETRTVWGEHGWGGGGHFAYSHLCPERG